MRGWAFAYLFLYISLSIFQSIYPTIYDLSISLKGFQSTTLIDICPLWIHKSLLGFSATINFENVQIKYEDSSYKLTPLDAVANSSMSCLHLPYDYFCIVGK